LKDFKHFMSSHFAGTHQPEEGAASASPSSSSSSTTAKTTSSENISKGTFWQRSKRLVKEVLSFYPSDLSNPHHRRLMNQAKARAVIVIGCFIYFGYHHPEYSVISAWYHGSNKPLAEQRYEKMSGGQKYGSQKMQENVLENIMEKSQRSVFEPKVEQQPNALSKLIFGEKKKELQTGEGKEPKY
jgi:hypothetical protein